VIFEALPEEKEGAEDDDRDDSRAESEHVRPSPARIAAEAPGHREHGQQQRGAAGEVGPAVRVVLPGEFTGQFPGVAAGVDRSTTVGGKRKSGEDLAVAIGGPCSFRIKPTPAGGNDCLSWECREAAICNLVPARRKPRANIVAKRAARATSILARDNRCRPRTMAKGDLQLEADVRILQLVTKQFAQADDAVARRLRVDVQLLCHRH